ncbi:migration and invasion enhancer 1 [Morphnus guianensis]
MWVSSWGAWAPQSPQRCPHGGFRGSPRGPYVSVGDPLGSGAGGRRGPIGLPRGCCGGSVGVPRGEAGVPWVCGDPHGTTELPRGSVRLRGDPAGGGGPSAARSSRQQVAQGDRPGADESERPETPPHVVVPGSGGRAAGPGAMSGGAEEEAAVAAGAEAEAERRVRIVVEYCEPCGFEPTYQELASAVKEEYPDIEIESRLGGTGAFEIEINGQLVFSKLENGGFPYEKDLIEAIRRARNGEPLEKITNSRPPCVIL